MVDLPRVLIFLGVLVGTVSGLLGLYTVTAVSLVWVLIGVYFRNSDGR